MASWLKAAEDLFEVVDRRAKLVVNDLADEQTAPVSNGQGSEVKKTKSNKKAQKKLSINESPISLNSEQPQTSPLTSQVDVIHEKDRSDYLNEDSTTSMTPHGESTSQKNSEKPHNTEKDTPALEIPSEDVQDIEVKYDVGQSVLATTTGADVIASSSKSEEKIESASDIHEEHFSVLPSQGFDVANEAHQDDVANEAHQDDVDQSKESGSLDVPSKHDLKSTSPLNSEPTSNDGSQSRYIVLDTKSELPVKQKQQQEKKADNFPKQIEDQLNEAQGLLKTSISSGQSKEARLARVCAGLSSRLQEYKSENAQLEELLIAERELSKSYEARIKQLQNDVSVSKSEVSRIECNMGEAMAAKNAEIEALVISMDALKKQAASSEGNLASLQATMESMMRNRELTETRMLQAVREELASVERRAEEEHAAHNATKKATMEREVELEHRAMEASSALARIQRMADERAARATELEQKVALLEVECSSLNQELQDLEARARRGQKKSPEDANQMIQVQAWQEEVERARQAQRDAESKLSSLDAEVQKMRVEMASMKRDAEHYSRQEHMELEKRYRELTDLLYYKQTQLEAMASEKAAAEFQLKKEVKRSQEAQVEVERSRVSRRASSTWEEDPEMKALEPLPLHHRHMVGASIQLQKAAKLLDSGAVRATRFLWRYPTARLILLFYLVFVHLFLMYLLHRLQDFADREVTESM